jgi:hypothetical protein
MMSVTSSPLDFFCSLEINELTIHTEAYQSMKDSSDASTFITTIQRTDKNNLAYSIYPDRTESQTSESDGRRTGKAKQRRFERLAVTNRK